MYILGFIVGPTWYLLWSPVILRMNTPRIFARHISWMHLPYTLQIYVNIARVKRLPEHRNT